MICNGIDPDQLDAFAKLLVAQPEAGAVHIRVRNRWREGYAASASTEELTLGGERVHRPHELHTDLAEQLGGGDRGPAPGELLLTALSACVTQQFVEHAAVRGVVVEHLRLDAEAQLDLRGLLGVEGVRPGVREVGLFLDVRADADDAVVDELLEAAVRTSPIADTVAHRVAITPSVRRAATTP